AIRVSQPVRDHQLGLPLRQAHRLGIDIPRDCLPELHLPPPFTHDPRPRILDPIISEGRIRRVIRPYQHAHADLYEGVSIPIAQRRKGFHRSHDRVMDRRRIFRKPLTEIRVARILQRGHHTRPVEPRSAIIAIGRIRQIESCVYDSIRDLRLRLSKCRRPPQTQDYRNWDSHILRSDDRPIPSAQRPFAGIVVDRVFGRQFFVDIYSQSRRLVDVHLPFLQLRRTGEYLFDQVVEKDRLLYPEIPDGQIDMTLRGMPYGRNIAGSMPATPYIEELTEVRHLERRCDAPDLRDMTAEIIEIAMRNIIHELVGVIEKLAHGERYRCRRP